MTDRHVLCTLFKVFVVTPAIFLALYALGAVSTSHPVALSEMILIAVFFGIMRWVYLVLVGWAWLRAFNNDRVFWLFVWIAPAVALVITALASPVVFPGVLLAALFSVVVILLEQPVFTYVNKILADHLSETYEPHRSLGH